MPRVDYRNIITRDPQIEHGEPCIRGLPVRAVEIVSRVLGGLTCQEILAEYPQLTPEDILACLTHAADQPEPLFILRDDDVVACKSPPLALAVPLSRFTSRVGGGLAFFARPLRTMKNILLMVLVGLLTGCHSNPPSTVSPARNTLPQFQQIHVGMSRDEVYQLLGKPQGVLAQGVKAVYSEIWVAPPDNHGQKVRLAVLFWADGHAHQVEQDILK